MILDRIALRFGMEKEYLAKVVQSASYRYKTYTIPKRTGGKRQIDHPAVELKLLQVWLVDTVLGHLPVHKAVFSYRSGVNIRDHCKVHLGNNYLLKVDFKDFFPSISADDVEQLLVQNQKRLPFSLTERDREIVKSIACKKGYLTIGAPSSPQISNAVMYDFDKYWYTRSRKAKIVYSRYADDLYFSTNKPGVLEGLFEEIKEDLRTRESPQLTINKKKTAYTSRKRRRLITGLVLTPTKQVSIGRKKKRYLKSLVFKFTQNELKPEQISYLRGYLSFVKSVEPSFLHSLQEKYGGKVLERISGFPVVTRKK